ncbi:adhesin [Alicyclobacillus suci]|uniref:adhesin n=1 Tax=Alicyclobacillus suci TaxID=2816080 RepID=UPI001A8C342C|nr:adhesin [Alicyclobacillus suci]
MEITNAGKAFVDKLLKEHQSENIRVIFAGAGCCGPKLGLSLDEPHEDDIVEIINDIKVAIENRVVPHTQGVTLDFQSTEAGSGLVLLGQSNC